MSLSDFQLLVDDLVRDDANKIGTATRDTAIAAAVLRYSKDRPRTKVQDITAAGGQSLSLPASWESDFSELTGLETPVGNVPPTLLGNNAYWLYASPSGLTIQMASSVAAGQTVRASYTIAHQVTSAADTVPAGDREAVSCLAAAALCDQLAGLYSGETDSTLRADTVKHQGKAGEYASRARSLRQRYFNELGVDPKRNTAAGSVTALERTDSLGRPRLTHGQRISPAGTP